MCLVMGVAGRSFVSGACDVGISADGTCPAHTPRSGGQCCPISTHSALGFNDVQVQGLLVLIKLNYRCCNVLFLSVLLNRIPPLGRGRYSSIHHAASKTSSPDRVAEKRACGGRAMPPRARVPCTFSENPTHNATKVVKNGLPTTWTTTGHCCGLTRRGTCRALAAVAWAGLRAWGRQARLVARGGVHPRGGQCVCSSERQAHTVVPRTLYSWHFPRRHAHTDIPADT